VHYVLLALRFLAFVAQQFLVALQPGAGAAHYQLVADWSQMVLASA
jgi:hypothetical protein